MKSIYQFHRQLIVRTPAFHYADFFDESFLLALLDNPHFAEAIYLASPVLFAEAIHWKNGAIIDTKKQQKVAFSLAKYYSRMQSRCTPFGLFAGCGIAEWNSDTALALSTSFERHTRLDMHFAGALSQQLADIPFIKYQLRYFPNSSKYMLGDEIRYVEYKYIQGKRHHQISAITNSEYIDFVVNNCQNGASVHDLANALIADDITLEEALGFIEGLIESQLLVSELEPAITGEEFTAQILPILKRINHENKLDGIIGILEKIDELLVSIDQRRTNSVAVYQEIVALIQLLNVPFDEGKLFQTDRISHFSTKSLSKSYQDELMEGIDVLYSLQAPQENTTLQQFIDKFYERFENQEVPLLLALDTEAGIGYGNTGKNHRTPIVEGLNSPPLSNDTTILSHTPFQKYLFRQWLKAYRNDEYQVVLDENEIKAFGQAKPEMAPSLPVMFRLTGNEQFPIFLENVGGSSAINIIGRFAHAHAEIETLAKEIAQFEQTQNPKVIFAEIVHLPENRVGNILLHPAFRAYEIPYLSKSSLSKEQQIPLDDLMVSVDIHTQKVILRSKKHNKEIIPRLSNAHNFKSNAVPVYEFLGDLQSQKLTNSVGISWKNVCPDAQFFPRICYKKLILEPASWQFKRADFEHLLQDSVSAEDIEAFWQKWRLPKRFVLSDADNELLVCTNVPLSVHTWLDTIKTRPFITLKEAIFDENTMPIQDTESQRYTNQIVAFLQKEKEHYQGIVQNITPPTFLPRTFSLGSEWLYFKLYGGVQSADTILAEAVAPLMTELLAEKKIDSWFFIRYADPDKHIRLRLHLPDLQHLGAVILRLKETLHYFENQKILAKIQIDTYQREIERYGENVMELSEQLFWYDSQAVVAFIAQTQKAERDELRWLWGLKAIDYLLNDIEIELAQKLQIMEQMKNSFAREFRVDKNMKLQLDQRFRDNRKALEGILASDAAQNHVLAPLLYSLVTKSQQTKGILLKVKSQKNPAELHKYLSDVIHMTVNRLMPDSQRLHELLLYDFLYRYYLSLMARNKGKGIIQKQ